MNLVLSHLYKTYGDQTVLRDFSCEFAEQKLTCLMGASGIGKSTLLNLIAGLEQPDSGQITYPDGTNMPPRPLPAVFQENRLCPGFDAITNVKLAVRDASPEEIRQEFAAVRLTDYEGKPVSALSGGMQRRVAIVRAVLAAGKCTTAPLVLLDEPLKGLDPKLYQIVSEYLASALAGYTAILVTHNPEEATFFGKELITL